MDTTKITNQLLLLAEECGKTKNTERPELKWLKEQHQLFMRKHRISNKKTADIFLYRQIYSKEPETEHDLLKLRYWRTGRHFPINHELCITYGKALQLNDEKLAYLLQGYYDSCDRIYETEDMQDPIYRKRRMLIDHLIENYLAHIPEERLSQMKIGCASQLSHNLRHLYYTDALNYVCYGQHTKNFYLTKHITSITYDSELKRTLQLLGSIPRKTILRHLIIFGMPNISLEIINQQLKDLGYLPLNKRHTLRTGEHLDRLLIEILEQYDTFKNLLDPEKCRQWFCHTLTQLDTYFELEKQKNLRFMYFKALKA